MGIPATEEIAPPPLDELSTALKTVMRRGLPVTPDAAPVALLNLRGVWARSIDPNSFVSRVKALDGLLRTLLLELGDGEEAQALQILFAARAENRGTTLTARRRRAAAAGSWEYDDTHFRKKIEPRLLRNFAWLLNEDSQTYTPRTRRAPPQTEISGDTPRLTAADINEQEELVSRIWALVYELRAEEIRKARLAVEDHTDESQIDDATGTCLWLAARLLTRIQDYLERYGERIVHGEAEFLVEGLIRLAGWSYELSSDDATRLRYALAKAGEMDRKRFLKEARAMGIGR